MKYLKLKNSIFLWAVLMLGCETRTVYHGQPLLKELIAQVRCQQSSKKDVSCILGSPAFISPFSKGDAWCYVYQKSQALGALPEKIVEHLVCVVVFNQRDTVQDIIQVNAMCPLDPFKGESDHVTHREEILKDIFQRLGRLNKASTK
jgi:outer membrane protein assembly factor BamE (lipoprotein component of BamABCDE complex)